MEGTRIVENESLPQLLAERAIVQQLHAFCRALDRLDPSLMRPIWHKGGTWSDDSSNGSSPACHHAERLIEELRSCQCHAHHVSGIIIRMEGDQAISLSQLTAVRRSRPDRTGMYLDRHLTQQCLDRWSRREGRWAIDHRRTLGEAVSEQNVEQGGRGERSRRDMADPVYALFAASEQ